jgi:hypothetical protein
MAKLTPKEKAESAGFLLDLFWQGGLIKPGDTSIGADLDRRWHGMWRVKKEVDAVCTEIVQRNFDFFNVDKAIDELSSCKFFVNPQAFGRVKGARMVTRNATQIAGFIASFCADQGIYWDDVNTHKTNHEMDQYRKTNLGGALWEYECFLSQQVNKANNPQPAATATSTSASGTTRAPRTPGQAPANPYKSTGPQSGNARDLKGQPNQKVYANTNVSFCIMADNAKSASPAYALVKPLSKQGAAGNTNKVFISSSHGYADCTCYFDDINDANAFLAQCNAKSWGPDISNLRIVKKASERNGYFLVGTEFGDCAISAKRMNEASALVSESSTKDYSINNIDVYAEAFMRE